MNGLENAKVGDKLIVSSRWDQFVLTVEKVQKNFVIAQGCKFRKSNGSRVTSDHWDGSSAKIATEEDLMAFNRVVKRQKMICQCSDIKFEKLSDSQLKQILEIANNHVKLD